MSEPRVVEQEQEHRRIELDVPALPSSLRVLRLVAADAVADEGADVEAVERASLVVDELAAVLVSQGSGDRLTVTVSRGDGSVRVDGCVASTGPTPEPDPVAAELLRMCAGEGRWHLGSEPGRLCFSAQLL